MKVFTCEDKLEDMLTCIYDAWRAALDMGHDNVRLMREPVAQLDMFAEYIHVEADMEKVQKVIRSIRRISNRVYMNVYYTLMSYRGDALDAVYRYLIAAFREGRSIEHMLTLPEVIKVMELGRAVSNEAHMFRERARFVAIDRRVYVCHIEPKSNVVMFVANHFADRMMSEHWMILDDNRKLAVIHPRDEDIYTKYLTDEELDVLKKLEDIEDEYTKMWRTFFSSISIEQRRNYECQRNMFPLWSRTHAPEFKTP